MTHRATQIGHLLFVALIGVVLLGNARLSAQPPTTNNLPIIMRAHGQPPASTLTTLVDRDCGFVTVASIPGTTRVIVGYIDRTQGNRLFIAEDEGDRLEDIPDPDGALRALLMPPVVAPEFVYDGPKQGAAAMIVIGDMLHIYATARDPDDSGGPFKLKRLSIPLSAIPD